MSMRYLHCTTVAMLLRASDACGVGGWLPSLYPLQDKQSAIVLTDNVKVTIGLAALFAAVEVLTCENHGLRFAMCGTETGRGHTCL